MVKIGIPRALLYYKYYPFWKTFLEGLDLQVLVSPLTNKEIFYKGINLCMDESCLPVKVFIGHIAALKDKVDYLFIPRIASVEKREFLCSKFWGLSDIARNLFPDCRILIPNIDLNRNSLYKTFFSFGLRFTRNPLKISKAFRAAQEAQKSFIELMYEEKLTPPEAIELWEEGRSSPKSEGPYRIRIALLSHSYNLYDGFINLDILKKLRNLEVEIFTAEMVPKDRLSLEAKAFSNIYWTYNRELAAAAMYYLKDGIDGIIFILSFACGPDSLIIDYLIRDLSQRIPVLTLVLDEHQANAGVLTRLESFVDLIRRSKR